PTTATTNSTRPGRLTAPLSSLARQSAAKIGFGGSGPIQPICYRSASFPWQRFSPPGSPDRAHVWRLLPDCLSATPVLTLSSWIDYPSILGPAASGSGVMSTTSLLTRRRTLRVGGLRSTEGSGFATIWWSP